MRIGLIAMSGIHCADAELAAVGLSLPGFLERGRAVASLPSLALLTLAGMTPAKHKIDYIEIPNLATVDGLPGEFDLVAISSYSAQIRQAYELADRYRAAGVRVVIGGPHVSMLPHEASQHADAVAIGEGEPIWLDILMDAERGELKQYYGAQFSKFDMRDAPLPAFHLLDPDKYNRLLVQTSRGCPHRCEFCASSILISNRYKQKPHRFVLSEVDAIKEIWRRPFIEFADDNTFINREYWYQLLPQLRKRQVRWFAETDISVAEDSVLLDMMRDAGCSEVLVGLESPTSAGLDHLELNANWKFKSWQKYKQAVDKIQRRGIRVIGCFVVGLDGQTATIADDIISYTDYLGLFDVQVTVMTAFPGTPLYRRMTAEGRLIEPENWDKCTLFDVNFKPSNMSVDELRACFRDLIERLYSAEKTQQRRARFKDESRALRRAG